MLDTFKLFEYVCILILFLYIMIKDTSENMSGGLKFKCGIHVAFNRNCFLINIALMSYLFVTIFSVTQCHIKLYVTICRFVVTYFKI